MLDDTGSSNLVLCDNLEGWDGMGGGRAIQEEGDTYTLLTKGWFMLICGRNQHSIVKQLSSR